jgi:pimeloyl-ACP methyl ester carboxylesterase
MQEKTIDVKGIKTSYMEEGTGAPVVFVHGLGGYKENWETNVPVFGERHRAIALDLPGYGRSEKPDVPYGPEFFASFVGKFMKALGVPRAHLVGNSMGGHLSLAAARTPTVDRLVLVVHRRPGARAGLGGDDGGHAGSMGPVNRAKISSHVPSLIFFKPGDYSEDGEAGDGRFRAGRERGPLRAFSPHRDLAHEMTPTTESARHDGLLGRNDPVISPRTIAGRSGSKKVILPEWTLPDDRKPEEFNRVVMDFLGSRRPNPGQSEAEDLV